MRERRKLGLAGCFLPPLAALEHRHACLALPVAALGSFDTVSLIAFEVVSDPCGEQTMLSPFVLLRDQESFQDQRFKQGV